jgi:hypothetical protein
MKLPGGGPPAELELEELEELEELLEELDPPDPEHEPSEVHGCPLPAGPLEVAGSFPCVHQLAL